MQGFIEFFAKLRVRFFGRSNSKSGFFNPGTDYFSFLKLRSKGSVFRADSSLNQIFAIRDLCVILDADPKDEHLVNCCNAKIDAGLQGSH